MANISLRAKQGHPDQQVIHIQINTQMQHTKFQLKLMGFQKALSGFPVPPAYAYIHKLCIWLLNLVMYMVLFLVCLQPYYNIIGAGVG